MASKETAQDRLYRETFGHIRHAKPVCIILPDVLLPSIADWASQYGYSHLSNYIEDRFNESNTGERHD